MMTSYELGPSEQTLTIALFALINQMAEIVKS